LKNNQVVANLLNCLRWTFLVVCCHKIISVFWIFCLLKTILVKNLFTTFKIIIYQGTKTKLRKVEFKNAKAWFVRWRGSWQIKYKSLFTFEKVRES
jgi:hypothetical protein